MTTEELREALTMSPKNGYTVISDAERQEMNDYCKRYMAFMDACKTEREATTWATQEAEKLGVGDDTDLEWWCWPQWPAGLR